VKKGETFWSISRQYKVDMRQLAGWNNMAPKDPLTTGRQLVIWRNGSPTVAATAPTSRLQANRLRKIKYRARSGDSYAGIADKFNVSLSEIKRWNNVNMKKYLQPGDMLTLYVDVANAP
jgi:membrane-bound lytic murein transglycosylase D